MFEIICFYKCLNSFTMFSKWSAGTIPGGYSGNSGRNLSPTKKNLLTALLITLFNIIKNII